MGVPVLILGESGSGKSASLRNFETNEIGIFNVAGKPLPFKKKLPSVNSATYSSINKGLSEPKLKTYVIDDSQYLMAFEELSRANEKGYQKFTDIALNFSNLVLNVINHTPDDVIVYFLHHTEELDTGKVKAKTSGKMIDNKLTLEGLFSIVLLCTSRDGEHVFITQSDGFTTCKSPMDMFPLEMDNDLKEVDTLIRSYYEFETETKEKK